MIGLVVGLVAPIIICIFTTVVFQYWAHRIRRKKGISLRGWRKLTPFDDSDGRDSGGHDKRTPSNRKKAISQVDRKKEPIAEGPRLSSDIVAPETRESSQPPETDQRSDENEGIIFYCKEHELPVQPGTWICKPIHTYRNEQILNAFQIGYKGHKGYHYVPPESRVTELPWGAPNMDLYSDDTVTADDAVPVDDNAVLVDVGTPSSRELSIGTIEHPRHTEQSAAWAPTPLSVLGSRPNVDIEEADSVRKP